MARSLAIIPARGGSKRIPRKNIKDFFGKPIIAYSIQAALKSGLFDEVMVSTDDEEIAAIARENGASVPFMRSNKNADDHATTMEVIQEVLEAYRQEGQSFAYACCIYPTAPLIRENHLLEGKTLLTKSQCTSVFPVVQFSYPIWRGLLVSEGDQSTTMLWPEHLNARSQDLEKVYHDAGQWYWLNVAKMKDAIFTADTKSVIIEEEFVQDIDTMQDWKLAELKYQQLTQS